MVIMVIFLCVLVLLSCQEFPTAGVPMVAARSFLTLGLAVLAVLVWLVDAGRL